MIDMKTTIELAREAGLSIRLHHDEAGNYPNDLEHFAELIRADAVPPGYVVVPVEPTQEMLDAMDNAAERDGGWTQQIYRAMLEAAPKEKTK